MLLQLQQTLRQLPPFKRVVVGVSGGADSVALALALKELKYEVIVAHLNHGLRGPESDQDAKFVKTLAQKLRVPYVMETAEIPREGNLENNARKIRYEFLENARRRLRADCIAVAHHRGDQLETVLMHLVRGAGPRGLAGMPLQRGKLIRPMLGLGKKEILAFLRKRGQPFCTDSTNQNLGYLRNRLRYLIIPHFKKLTPRFAESLLALSRWAKKELERLENQATSWLMANVEGGRFPREHFQVLEHALKGEILIRLLGPQDLYQKQLNKLIYFIETAKAGKQMMLKQLRFTSEYADVRVGLAKQARPLPQKEVTSAGVRWGNWTIRKTGRAKVFVRSWKPGDRFEPAGMKGNKKLQDFFVDHKIPRSERGRLPILVNGKNEILSVGNLRWSRKGRAMKNKLFTKNNIIVK